MKYGLYFHNGKLVADLTVYGNAVNGHSITGVLMDTGASISGFLASDLTQVGATARGVHRSVRSATGSTTLPVYLATVELGGSQNLTPTEARHKALVEQRAVDVLALPSLRLIGRDVLARFNCLEVDWAGAAVIDAAYA